MSTGSGSLSLFLLPGTIPGAVGWQTLLSIFDNGTLVHAAATSQPSYCPISMLNSTRKVLSQAITSSQTSALRATSQSSNGTTTTASRSSSSAGFNTLTGSGSISLLLLHGTIPGVVAVANPSPDLRECTLVRAVATPQPSSCPISIVFCQHSHRHHNLHAHQQIECETSHPINISFFITCYIFRFERNPLILPPQSLFRHR